MKNSYLRITLCLILSSLTLSSCLEGGDNNLESGQDLAFITSCNNVKCAATSCGYITSSAIQSLSMEECYLVSYSISKSAIDGIYTPDYFTNLSVTPLPQQILRTGTPQNESENNSSVTDLSVPYFFPTAYMGDRWLFRYNVVLNNTEKMTPHFYYNPNNQVDKNGADISGSNKIVIDVYFEKSAGTTTVSSTNQYLVVANFSPLRNLYNPDYSQTGSGKVNVQLLFRYSKTGSDNIEYVGDWDTYSNLYMTFNMND